jgi:antitoxin FitA
MPTDISLKNVPDEIVEKLRLRAKKNHRSLQGELIAILETTVAQPGLSLDQVEAHLTDLRFTTAGEAANWVRELRDGR